VFIGFILTQLPHGIIGPARGGDVRRRARLEGRANSTRSARPRTIDLWRHFRPLAPNDEARNMRNAKWLDRLLGRVCDPFAVFVTLSKRT
jgi:hypothetical protein